MEKVLIVSDSAAGAFRSILALEKLFSEIQVCNSSDAAAQLAKGFKPDLIVASDQIAPRRTAAEVAFAVNAGRVPVILMSTGLSSVQGLDPSRSVRIEPPLTSIRVRQALEQLGLAGGTVQTSSGSAIKEIQ